MQNTERYLRLVCWADRRYRDDSGRLVLTNSGGASRFTRIESAAAVKHLGHRPRRLGTGVLRG